MVHSNLVGPQLLLLSNFMNPPETGFELSAPQNCYIRILWMPKILLSNYMDPNNLAFAFYRDPNSFACEPY